MARVSSFNIFVLTGRTIEQFKIVNEKLQTKIKGTILEKLAKYTKSLYNDYKEVAISVRTDARDKPIKAAFILTALGTFFVALKTNPDENSFRAKFIDCCNDVSTVSNSLVNPESASHLANIQKFYNKDLIRHTSFGVLSVIWVDKYSKECDNYETNCSYLQLPYRKFPNSVIDVGFMNVWWSISRKMLDFDINY